MGNLNIHEWKRTFSLVFIVTVLLLIMISFSNCSPFDKGNKAAAANEQNANDPAQEGENDEEEELDERGNNGRNNGNGKDKDKDKDDDDDDADDDDDDSDDSDSEKIEKILQNNGKKCEKKPEDCAFVCINGNTFFIEEEKIDDIFDEFADDNSIEVSEGGCP